VPCAEFEFDSVSDRPSLVRNPLTGIWYSLCVTVENVHAQRLIDTFVTCDDCVTSALSRMSLLAATIVPCALCSLFAGGHLRIGPGVASLTLFSTFLKNMT
jgi:hypothetical protein